MGEVVAGRKVAAPATVFSRESSGFVRVGTPWRMALMNVANIGVAYIMFTYWSHPGVFPQSNLLIAIPVAVVLALPINILYWMFSTMMPRTGGEYVYLTRTFHPVIGFMASFAAAISQSFWSGIGGYWIAQLVLGPLAASYGAASGNSTFASIGAWANTPSVWLGFGTVFLIVMCGINLFGLKFYLKFQDVNWVAGAVTLAILLGVLFLSSHDSFISGFNQYAAATKIPNYADTLALAAKSGMPTGFNLMDTLGIVSIIWLISWCSTYVGGEVRTPQRSQLIGMVGGLLLYGGIVFVVALGIAKSVGLDFNQALTWLSYNPPANTTVEPYPVMMLYAGVLSPNVLVFALIAVGLVLWSYFWIPTAIMIATRNMFAWSFDRLVPEKLSEVHPRYQSPWVAVLSVAVIGEAFLIVYHFGYFKFLTPTLAYYFIFWVVGLAGVVFPYLKHTRPILEKSSFNKHFLGIPVMTLTGLGSLLYFSIGLYFMLTQPALGLNTPQILVTTGAQFAIPLVLFFVMRAYRKSQGIPIDAAFRELPPE